MLIEAVVRQPQPQAANDNHRYALRPVAGRKALGPRCSKWGRSCAETARILQGAGDVW